MLSSEIQTVKEWHDALNDSEVDRLVSLSNPEIEVGGPRGTARGSRLLREWVVRANIHLEPRRMFHHRSTVIVEQDATWHSRTGQITGSQTVASIFIVRDGCIASVVRYDSLPEAFRAAGLDESCEVRPD